jgi:Leucine-rich repeat (LRR) protein
MYKNRCIKHETVIKNGGSMKKSIFCFLIIIAALFSNFVFGAIPAEERTALIALYNSTNGDGWADKTGWKTSPLHTDGFGMPGTEGSWYGVTVTGGHVTKILMRCNKLTGEIPSELGDLSELEEFYIINSDEAIEEYWNHVGGTIPSELGKLGKLKKLDISGGLLIGSIPAELGNLGNLEELVLAGNKLGGAVPTELGKLSKLKSLWLSSNQLSSIPKELGNLGNLQGLGLSGNRLSGGIPSELGNLSNLQTFDLSYNRLSGGIPSQLGNLSKLTYLGLRGNQLSGSIPYEIGNLGNLVYLFLFDNRLSGSIPSSFTNLTKLETLEIGLNCLSATDPALIAWLNSHFPGWDDNQDRCGGTSSELVFSRHRLNFSYIISGSIPNPQTVQISNTGGGEVNWSGSCPTPWLTFTPTYGTGVSEMSVSVDPSGLAAGDYSTQIIIMDPYVNDVYYSVDISLHVYQQGETHAPFGAFATPKEGSSVSNSIPVTGWALDNIGIANVKIYNGDTYIGDAVFVDGARPDVEALYPTYPYNYKAGWGYMLLTRTLPNGGNGTYTLTAKATDMEGNVVTLGSKTITIDNAHAVKPFGAVDTPTQGGTASGKSFTNFGWVLTPQPNSIPVDGSTINVFIDGVLQGHPGYDVNRPDIAELFPGYANTGGAGGYFYFDTTVLKNGVHTISWDVTDSAGNSDGIGSRYFTVSNTGTSGDLQVLNDTRLSKYIEPSEGFNTDEGDADHIEIKELERIHLPVANTLKGYLVVGGQLRDLPIGSTLDSARGIFYWQPGPGFVGEYRFVFIVKGANGQYTKKNIVVNIKPKN